MKERLFGVSGKEGNHGEDVKEVYWYLDGTPTCSYARALYKYPQRAFPYEELRRRSREAGKRDREPEILDTAAFDEDRYFDVQVEYAKEGPDDLLVRITATNRGPQPAPLVLLPQLWFRNTWTWSPESPRPELFARDSSDDVLVVETAHEHLGSFWLYAEGAHELLFTENESNAPRLWGTPSASPYVKDAFHEAIVRRRHDAVNPERRGTKVGARYAVVLEPQESLVAAPPVHEQPARDAVRRPRPDLRAPHPRGRRVLRGRHPERALRRTSGASSGRRRRASSGASSITATTSSAGCAATRPSPPPPANRRSGRNGEWRHLYNSEVLSMPDKWEYPWYAAWDLAFHCIPLSLVDPEFAKQQLKLLVREWYMHPNGQIPAYEWQLADVNPPVHAWAAYRVYQIERRTTGRGDRDFLESVFLKLMLNFTWWVNRKDTAGRNVFEGGFLGLDNIGVFDRSKPLPGGGALEQADAHELDGDVLPEHARHRARARAREPELPGRRQQVLRALPVSSPTR